jgi:hypothetical protein
VGVWCGEVKFFGGGGGGNGVGMRMGGEDGVWGGS